MWRSDVSIEDVIDRIVGGGTPVRNVEEFWNGEISWASVKDISDNSYYLSSTLETITREGLASSASNLIPPNTAIVCTRMSVGSSALTSRHVAINQDLKAVFGNKDEIKAEYLVWQLKHHQEELDRKAIGSTVKGISVADLKKLRLYRPRIHDQEKIVNILGATDSTIEKTQALIAKYENIKQGMMQDLFTRGVDENGQLRPSYEDAPHLYQETDLGWIPKDWKFSSLDGVAPLVTSGSRDWARFYADFGDVFVRIGNLTREHVNFRMQNLQHVALGDNKEGTRTKLLENDILISITADLGIIGIVPDWNFDAYINQHIALVRADSSLVEPRYLAHYLASSLGRKQFEMLNESGAKAGLNLPTIRSLKCYLPDGDEQKSIYQALDSADTNVAKARNDLEKLKSIKLGLMQDLLTGKVRVAEDMDECKEAVA